MQLVHVVLASGTRHERTFSDKATPEAILAQLARIKHVFGRVGRISKRDPKAPELPVAEFEDPKSPYVFDDPSTAVVVLKTDELGEAVADEYGEPVVAKVLRAAVKPAT